jgi:hypothetical protein
MSQKQYVHPLPPRSLAASIAGPGTKDVNGTKTKNTRADRNEESLSLLDPIPSFRLGAEAQ